jgi:hypothetical protein
MLMKVISETITWGVTLLDSGARGLGLGLAVSYLRFLRSELHKIQLSQCLVSLIIS